MTGNFDGVADATIQSELNLRMNNYIPGARFEFPSATPVKELFDGLFGNDGLVQIYEKQVDDWARANHLAAIPQSKERLALLSLSYNNVLGKSTLLAKAIKDNNRAEAWFEIRYGSNSDRQPANIKPGLAKRRFEEAQLFGLYEGDGTSASPDEANHH